MNFPLKLVFLVAAICVLCGHTLAQVEDVIQLEDVISDTTSVENTAIIVVEEETHPDHPPRKATILSAVLPGAGQFYNKKYWKMPIVYAGFAISGYYLDRNLKEIKYFRKNLQAELDDDPLTINETGASTNDLAGVIDQYKSLRDWSYIAIAGVYVLQILDANVDAHLWHFDVSNDLSLTAMPSMIFTSTAKPGVSLILHF